MTLLIETSEIESLAPMPASVARLAAMLNDPDVGAVDVARVVEFDEALTANLLKLANSAWSGARHSITTVKEAVLRLGVGRILELAVGRHVAGPMNKPCKAYDLAEHELWRHSVAAALATEHMGQLVKTRIPGAAFTAALVHDIGKLVLGRHLSDEVLEQIRRTVLSDGLPYVEAERRVLKTDHAEVGAEVARSWQFPEELVSAIEHHHNPDGEPDPVLDAVHIANAVAKLIGVGLGAEQMNMTVSAEASKRLGLSSSGLETLCATVADELEKTEELLRSD